MLLLRTQRARCTVWRARDAHRWCCAVWCASTWRPGTTASALWRTTRRTWHARQACATARARGPMVRTRVRCAAAAAAVACCTQPAAAVTQYGTVVYSATPAGVAAAVAAAANGAHRVALVEPLANIGGMGAAGGLGLHDQQMANLTMVTGLARDWAERNARYYPGSDSELVHHPDMYVAEASFREMVADAKSVELLTGCRLESVRRDAARLRAIAAITVLCSEESEGGGGRRVELAASLFVDASYDAEVVVGAGGVDTAWGRESRNTYGEPLAGAQYTQYGIESFDALGGAVSGTRPDGTVLHYVERGAPPPEGTAVRLERMRGDVMLRDTIGDAAQYILPRLSQVCVCVGTRVVLHGGWSYRMRAMADTWVGELAPLDGAAEQAAELASLGPSELAVAPRVANPLPNAQGGLIGALGHLAGNNHLIQQQLLQLLGAIESDEDSDEEYPEEEMPDAEYPEDPADAEEETEATDD